MLTFGAIGLGLNFVMYWFSDRIALLAHRAQEVSRAEAPTLFAIVERLTRRAGMPMPRIYLIPSAAAERLRDRPQPEPRRGRGDRRHLQILSERELEGVLAHELSHVRNRDVLIATIAAGVAGLISTLGHVLQWGLMFGGAGSRSSDERGSGLAALAWIVVAPIIALSDPAGDQPLARAGRRQRGRGAERRPGRARGRAGQARAVEDRAAVRVCRPGDVAPVHREPAARGRGAALMGLFSTHPPTEERVRRLRADEPAPRLRDGSGPQPEQIGKVRKKHSLRRNLE